MGDPLVQRLGSSGAELKTSHAFENFKQTKIMLAWTEVDRNRMKCKNINSNGQAMMQELG